jgi:predicted GH43/DUF377 family glycosyl hydrolase
MNWIKLKNIFCPDNKYDWMVSHASNPVAMPLNKNCCRIFFTCRNKNNQSFIAFADVDFKDDFKILRLSKQPVLSPGEAGMFDDSGVAVGSIIRFQNKLLLYYVGWNLKVTVPWMNTIGMAAWNNRKNCFEKYSRAPVMDRSEEDPFSISYPSVMQEKNRLRMWYGSNLKWGKNHSDMQHVIKYAESKNGIHWTRSGKAVVPLVHPGEYALSRPSVLKEKSGYSMWYSYRSVNDFDAYKIGYAESKDGLKWKRKDELAGIDVSTTGWDSEMICYPFVFDHAGNRFLLYNGNEFGKTGFGIAVLEK